MSVTYTQEDLMAAVNAETKRADDAQIKATEFARALVDVLDGVKDHDIRAMTGLSEAACARISHVRDEALRWLEPNVQEVGVK